MVVPLLAHRPPPFFYLDSSTMSKASSSHLSAAIARTNLVVNTSMACRADGCNRPRRGFGIWCRSCLPKARKLGHPNARGIRPSEYKETERRVRSLFAGANADHPGLVYATQALEAWMAEALESSALPQKRWPHPSVPEVARLARHGVTARDLLVRLCSVYYFLRSNPTVLPSDDARSFAVSHALIKLAPRASRLSRSGRSAWTINAPRYAVAHLGKHLRVWLASFLEVVAQALDQRDVQRASVVAALRQPFGVPAAAILAEQSPT
jgi:hypothetical protein